MGTKYLTFNKQSDNLLLTAGRLRNPLINGTQEPLSVTSASSLTLDTSSALVINSSKFDLDSNGNMDLTGVLKINNTDILTTITETLNIGQDASFSNVDISGILDLTNVGKIRGPAVMYIDPHTHEDNSGSLVILGNLEVKGTTFTVHSQTVEISDNKIAINANWNAVSDAGITINLPGGSANSELVWNLDNARWQVSEPFYMGDDLTVNNTLTVTNSFSSTNFKFGGTDFTNSLKIGTSTTGTLNNASSNTLIGINCANSITEGDNNTALGFESLKLVTTGGNNVGIGYQSGDVITTGSNNICIGNDSIPSANNAVHEISIGTSAQTRGNYSVSIGSNSEARTKSVSIGYDAGAAGGGLDQNVLIGYNAGISMTGGRNNVVVGFDSGKTISGNHNTVVGAIAGTITSGSHNCIFGQNSAYNMQTNTQSIIFGALATASANGNTNETVIGHNLNGNGSNTVTIGNSSITATYLRGTLNLDGTPLELNNLNDGNVTATSSYFIGGGGNSSTSGSNSCFGYQSGLNLSSGVNNTLLGTDAGKTLSNQQNNILLGRETGRQATCSYSTYIGVAAGFSSTATHNIGLGQGTAHSNNGSYNIAIGPPADGHVDTFTFHAASSACTGNIAIGEASMQRNQTTPARNGQTTWTGTNNICIGKWSSLNAANTSNAIAIGHSVLANSNEIVLGNSSVTSLRIPGLDFSIIDNSLSFVGNADISGSLTVNGSLSMNGAFTIPNTDGSVDQVLQTNGSGVLSWTTIDPALSYGAAVSSNSVTDNEHHSWLGYNSLSVGSRSVTLGWKSGGGNDSACYGKYAGFGGGNNICAVGANALGHGAGNNATAMGQAAGGHVAGTGSVNLGYWAGQTSSQQYSVNIGYYSGKTSAGDYSINIGANTNKNVACADNSITINSTGQVTTCSSTNKAICITADPSLVTTTESGLYIAPVRENTGTNLLSYDTSSYEISYLTDGSNGQVLTTNGSGVTSWVNSKTHHNTFSVVDASNLQTNLTKTAATWIDLSGTSDGYKVSVTPSTTNCRVKLEFKVNYITSNESDQPISFKVMRNPGSVKVFQDLSLGTTMGVTSRGIYNGTYIDHPNSTNNVSYHLEYMIGGSDIDVSSGVMGYDSGNGSYNFISAQELFAP
tara:strand:+ start:1948 stop:5349 length:3402 start_codon:yes stop_codon:yes gene_type:complete